MKQMFFYYLPAKQVKKENKNDKKKNALNKGANEQINS